MLKRLNLKLYKDSIATASDVDYFKIAPVSDPSQITIDFTGFPASNIDDEFTFLSLMRPMHYGIIGYYYGNGY